MPAGRKSHRVIISELEAEVAKLDDLPDAEAERLVQELVHNTRGTPSGLARKLLASRRARLDRKKAPPPPPDDPSPKLDLTDLRPIVGVLEQGLHYERYINPSLNRRGKH